MLVTASLFINFQSGEKDLIDGQSPYKTSICSFRGIKFVLLTTFYREKQQNTIKWYANPNFFYEESSYIMKYDCEIDPKTSHFVNWPLLTTLIFNFVHLWQDNFSNSTVASISRRRRRIKEWRISKLTSLYTDQLCSWRFLLFHKARKTLLNTVYFHVITKQQVKFASINWWHITSLEKKLSSSSWTPILLQLLLT